MGLILWIDQNTFATTLIERVYKRNNEPFYTLPSVEGFSYLVDDLNPVLIVLERDTYAKNPKAFKDQYLASEKMQATPFIILGSREEFGFIKNILGEIQKPLDPFNLPRVLKTMLGII